MYLRTFRCACCEQSKPILGRKQYKFTGTYDIRGKKKYSYQCKDCVKKELTDA